MLSAFVLSAVLIQGPATTPVPALTDTQMEEFLLHARVSKTRTTRSGVTLSQRATLSDGTLIHDAQIQQIEMKQQSFPTARGVEFNFRDSWMYNVAAYRLDRLIGLNMVPVSVVRRHAMEKGAFTWWVDDVMMDEGERLKRKVAAPDTEHWNRQMQLVRVFDQLIANTDRNVGNLLITRDWRIWPIDHTRAFRLNRTLRSAANVTRCDRQVLENMKGLTKELLRKRLDDVLTADEIDALLARRDAIVKRLEAGGASVLFTRAQP